MNDMTKDNDSDRPTQILLNMTRRDFQRLSYTTIAWSAVAEIDGRFEFDESVDPWDPKWDAAEITFHSSSCYADALIARAYLTALGLEWIAVWDMAEDSRGEPWGHATIHQPLPG